MSTKQSILGVWLIERGSGRNLVAKCYSDAVKLDMDLIAPFLSATHTFIDKASNETLKTVDTETNRYVWEANDHLLFVMVVSKAARLGHMRFMLEYALNEFMKKEVPPDSDVATLLKNWHGAPGTFKNFGRFVDELVTQYEATDESLVAGKSMDCLEVYSHLFRGIMKVKGGKKKKETIVKRMKGFTEPLLDRYPFLLKVPIDIAGIEVLDIDVNTVAYQHLRDSLEELLRLLGKAVREIVTPKAYKDMLFDYVMPYVKHDIQRLQTYAILDDVVRYLF
ncbi:MAG: hypothetical protein AM326_06055 [Candidatus Thorarchaeota archaeon SMTZ-45]|nr:MAG: hypothetical protein AM325_04375 [Candidatus Thorarchaeota archaeon SMTZ1-45]KXH76961.1 MAG: hypothetical protein AM326_06055 [Candidatus Thorarchaeota archaeon SMTZ-45]